MNKRKEFVKKTRKVANPNYDEFDNIMNYCLAGTFAVAMNIAFAIFVTPYAIIPTIFAIAVFSIAKGNNEPRQTNQDYWVEVKK